MLGSNPIAIAVPAEPVPFLYDGSTTVVTRGKLEIYNKLGKPLPDGWALDENGNPSTDAPRVLSNIVNKTGGGIMPVGGSTETLGGHKGYGFGMICEILCAITSCGATSNHHVRAKGQGAGTCHSFIVIDPCIFGSPQELKANLSLFLQELRDAKRANESVPIYTHGEKEMLAYEQHMQEGIDVDISTVSEMINICNYLGMNSIDYLGNVDVSDAKTGTYEKTYQ
jgi:LDH2 family malate/lactate/ureidoglycolate dehydrogenase